MIQVVLREKAKAYIEELGLLYLPDDVKGKKEPEKSWCFVSCIPVSTPQASMGRQPIYRLRGLLVFGIHVDVDKGGGSATQFVDAITDRYANPADEIVFETSQIDRIGSSGKWWQVNVTFPWYADVRKS